MDSPERVNLRSSLIGWTIAALVAEASLAWGLTQEGWRAGFGINVGWFGMFVVAAGAWRKAPLAERIWPIAVASGCLGLWGAFRSAIGDEDALALAGVVLLLMATLFLLAGGVMFLVRRGWIIDTPLRRHLTFAVLLVSTMSSVMGVPTGVWKGRLSLVALTALLAISIWPPSASSKPVHEP